MLREDKLGEWDGRDISVWRDKWVSNLHVPLSELEEAKGSGGLKVYELIENGSAWDERKLGGVLFSSFARKNILNTPIGESGMNDEMRWCFDENGVFSVKSAYLLAIGFYEQDPNTSEPDRKMWSRLV